MYHIQFSSVQSLSCVQLFVTPRTAACPASLSITSSQRLLKLMSKESVMPSNHLILCCPLLPSIFPSIRVFSNESALRIRWPKYWSFSSSISPANEYSGLISFRMDQLDLLAVQGTLKSLLQLVFKNQDELSNVPNDLKATGRLLNSLIQSYQNMSQMLSILGALIMFPTFSELATNMMMIFW